MKTYAFRLRSGQDLREEIDRFTKENNIKAGCVVSSVGSLQTLTIRLAGAVAGLKEQPVKVIEGPLEIVSLVGTGELGNSHLHISVSDIEGNVFGGHLRAGSIVHTTAEIVLGELENVTFLREPDPESGFPELKVVEE